MLVELTHDAQELPPAPLSDDSIDGSGIFQPEPCEDALVVAILKSFGELLGVDFEAAAQLREIPVAHLIVPRGRRRPPLKFPEQEMLLMGRIRAVSAF